MSAPATDSMFGWSQDANGIVTLTMDDPARRANTMTEMFATSLHTTLDRLETETAAGSVSGIVLTSAKSTFFAGGDLTLLAAVTPLQAPRFGEWVEGVKADLRRLEKLGVPTVAALNGTALGGGLEIALACNHRIALNDPTARFGLPEVTLGILPGVGGVTRIVRMLGIETGLMAVLLKGNRYRPEQAVEVGIVDELADDPAQLMANSLDWIAAHPRTQQPWDDPSYRMPGGTPSSPKLAGYLPAFPANLRKQLKGAPMPAPHHIMCAAVEGAAVDVDTALRIEGRYFLDLVAGQVAKNMIQAFWFDLNAINAGSSRPAGHQPRPATRIAVIGAGMMGAGIAYVSAKAGIDVVLKDVDPAAAERGKQYSAKLLDKQVARGTLTAEQRERVLARITTSADYADLAGCDLVVEAVFEKASLKREVFAAVEPAVAPDALLGSNTSTLPITALADGVSRTADFIGLHFFSPVDKMPLLEIIRGEHTSDAALARALDFAAQIRKTPIVVNDSRGFFTSRVISTFVFEALAMLGEGIAPNTVEQAALQAGYPVGALQLADELNLGLFVKIRDETRAAAGDRYVRHPAEDVFDALVAAERPGRLGGGGFYDYDEAGARTGLWAGLGQLFAQRGDPAEVDLAELSERMLVIEAVESARCMEEGVLLSAADANIGSIMGIGYPAWTGGVLQYINGFPGGVAAFVDRAQSLAKRFGPRFEPNALLHKKVANSETF